VLQTSECSETVSGGLRAYANACMTKERYLYIQHYIGRCVITRHVMSGFLCIRIYTVSLKKTAQTVHRSRCTDQGVYSCI